MNIQTNVRGASKTDVIARNMGILEQANGGTITSDTMLGEPQEAVLAQAELETQRDLLDQAGRAATATEVLEWGTHP